MKKENLKVVEKKDATEGLSGEQLGEINEELEMSMAVLDLLSATDHDVELDKNTVEHVGFFLKEKILRVFKILNGEA